MKTIGVFFGGRSAEHDISIITALLAVIKPLQLSSKYQVVPVYIDKKGRWFTGKEFLEVSTFRQKNLDAFLDKKSPLSIQMAGGLELIESARIGSKTHKIDVAFPAMHGTYGEDGSLMGLLRMCGVPFVGCDILASAIAMDKITTKQVVMQAGLLTPKFVWFDDHQYSEDPKTILKDIAKLKYPLFVKPAHLGSSIGIAMVKNKKELENAIEVALHYDDRILVEEGVNNLVEVTVPVMGNKELTLALVEESIPSESGYYDFEQKYIGGGGKKGGGKKASSGAHEANGRRLPAKLSKLLYADAEQAALDTFQALDCRGTARVDLLIDKKTKKVYVNEVNTLPGSLFAHNWKLAGFSNLELVDNLIALAEEEFQRRSKLNITFQTNFLSQF